jgi:probable HAF family extracellular repeat protein
MWLNRWWQRGTGPARARRVEPRARCVPRVEVLEDRSLPSAGYGFATLPQPPNALASPVFGINNQGQVVGETIAANDTFQGYLLSQGQFTLLNDPNAGTAPGQGTVALGINDQQEIVGNYVDANNVLHGYLLSHGQYTTLDDPNSTGAFQLTQASGINDRGQIVGVYVDNAGALHGFLRSNGQYTTLDDPLAGPGGFTFVQGINDLGQVVGDFSDASGTVSGAFVYRNGQYTTLNVPNALFTAAEGINDSGQIVGVYFDASVNLHSFVYRNGQYTTLNDPLAGPGGFTVPSGINDLGQIVGGFSNASGTVSGNFLATPTPGNSGDALDGGQDLQSLVSASAILSGLDPRHGHFAFV